MTNIGTKKRKTLYNEVLTKERNRTDRSDESDSITTILVTKYRVDSAIPRWRQALLGRAIIDLDSPTCLDCLFSVKLVLLRIIRGSTAWFCFGDFQKVPVTTLYNVSLIVVRLSNLATDCLDVRDILPVIFERTHSQTEW